MKIVFTASGTELASRMNPRFGRTVYLLLFNTDDEQLTVIDNSESTQAAHGAGPLAVQRLFDLQADVLITGNGPGDRAAELLREMSLKIYTGAGDMTVAQALEAFQADQLTEMTV